MERISFSKDSSHCPKSKQRYAAPEDQVHSSMSMLKKSHGASHPHYFQERTICFKRSQDIPEPLKNLDDFLPKAPKGNGGRSWTRTLGGSGQGAQVSHPSILFQIVRVVAMVSIGILFLSLKFLPKKNEELFVDYVTDVTM